jgi:hypothetical protein
MDLGKIKEDQTRNHIYRDMCITDKAVILYYPHKFSESRNTRIPFSNVSLNPKNFACYSEMESYLFAIFGDSKVSTLDFNTTRIDIAVDIAEFPVDVLLSILRIQRVKTDSLNFFKGTIYAGSNPKIRIYDKTKELKHRIRRGKDDGLTEYEKQIIDSGKIYTRFEVQIRKEGKSLQDIIDDPYCYASYFDRLEIFDFGDSGEKGVLQVLYKYINRKHRADLERYRATGINEEIKERYREHVREWFSSDIEPF